MPISINGTGSITGLSAGGLPDASITADDIASNAVTTAKVNDAAITYGKLSTSATEGDNVAKRTAKAWVNFNGTGTVAIRDDFNISSITDGGVGIYTLNFSSNLSDANYSATFGARGAGDTEGPYPPIPHQYLSDTTSTSQFKFVTASAAATKTDYSTVSVQIFGS